MGKKTKKETEAPPKDVVRKLSDRVYVNLLKSCCVTKNKLLLKIIRKMEINIYPAKKKKDSAWG